MEQLQKAIRNLITISEEEMNLFLKKCTTKVFKKKEVVSKPNEVPNAIFFINKGILRVIIEDNKGNQHSLHFALENQFIADYSSFIQQTKSIYTLEALEDTEVVVLPKATIDWGYLHLKEGQKMGRLIAEYYFIYQDNRIQNNYFRTPKERFDAITEVFPNIHNRVPQHMIASYLGITSIHLSRLKKT